MKRLNPEDPADQQKVKKLKEELIGHPVVDAMPVEVHAEFARDSVGMTLAEWRAHSIEDQARIMVIHELKGKIELLERFESALERANASSKSTARKGRSSRAS